MAQKSPATAEQPKASKETTTKPGVGYHSHLTICRLLIPKRT